MLETITSFKNVHRGRICPDTPNPVFAPKEQITPDQILLSSLALKITRWSLVWQTIFTSLVRLVGVMLILCCCKYWDFSLLNKLSKTHKPLGIRLFSPAKKYRKSVLTCHHWTLKRLERCLQTILKPSLRLECGSICRSPSPLRDKTRNLLWKTSPKFRIFWQFSFLSLVKWKTMSFVRTAYLLELTVHQK